MAKETAEKKLLKLIETTQAQEAPAAGTPESAQAAPEAQQVLNAVRGVGMPSLSLPPFVSQLMGLLKGGTSARQGPLGLREINQIFLFVILAAGVFVVLSFFSGMRDAEKAIDLSAKPPVAADAEQILPQVKNLIEYMDAVAQRNIFEPYEAKVAETVGEGETIMDKISQQTQNLRLVGISWLDTPETASAMIENIDSGVTYFLKPGERINSITVQKIYADSIIISFEDEEMEMRL